jgi:hypothetical protein
LVRAQRQRGFFELPVDGHGVAVAVDVGGVAVAVGVAAAVATGVLVAVATGVLVCVAVGVSVASWLELDVGVVLWAASCCR